MRDRMVGLPLQRSTFDQIDTLGELIGLAHALPGGRFDAHLDDTGSLRVAHAHVEALRRAFPTHPEPGFLASLEGTRRDRCAALRSAWTRAEGCRGSTRRLAAEVAGLLSCVADVVPYAILSKFVPQLLRDALVAGDGLPLPAAVGPSPGAQLTRSLMSLAAWCHSRGVGLEELATRWPDVDPTVRSTVEAFCVTHAGFGPVAWEAPGFADPRFTLRAMAGLGEVSAASGHEPVFSALDPGDDQTVDLAGAYVAWQAFTERQIWYVRTAFHRGIAPLVRRLGATAGVAPHRLLFLTRHEIAGERPGDDVIDRRIAAYGADSVYLQRHAIDPGRLVDLTPEHA